jgi:hypothetical protein
MTDATVTAALPEVRAILVAAKTAVQAIITNPVNAPGALLVFNGTVLLQFPILVTAEQGAVAADAGTLFDGLIAKIDAQLATKPPVPVTQ